MKWAIEFVTACSGSAEPCKLHIHPILEISKHFHVSLCGFVNFYNLQIQRIKQIEDDILQKQKSKTTDTYTKYDERYRVGQFVRKILQMLRYYSGDN